MKISFVVISVGDRIQELNALVESIIRFYPCYDVNLLLQAPQGLESPLLNRDHYTNIFEERELLGCHGARVQLLNRMPRYGAYINLDDDMLLTEHTRYAPALYRAMEPETGFVLTNWARTEALLAAKVHKMKEEFIPQALVYQGGGMIYREEIAALMRELEPIKATFDTEWPLTAYLAGYTNYRYRGSLAVHRVCTKGGMSQFMADNPALTVLDEYVTYKKAKRQDGSGQSLLIPMDADLTPLAKWTHAQNKARRSRI